MRATVESHESATVYVSSFTALIGTTMADYTDSLQALLLALQACIGIQTRLVLGPLSPRLVETVKMFCLLSHG